jgi:hypothetical protein
VVLAGVVNKAVVPSWAARARARSGELIGASGRVVWRPTDRNSRPHGTEFYLKPSRLCRSSSFSFSTTQGGCHAVRPFVPVSHSRGNRCQGRTSDLMEASEVPSQVIVCSVNAG